ncbi:UNVERIFIED_CONTAM: hypothetical protein Sradi_1904900 [Sesamum radiatum]|uniref:RNase H type-1 domain-containing protein n=1 Tax=Sesamum radiatum TaxID=300843 RepID=A0AAW2TXE0_SESRA
MENSPLTPHAVVSFARSHLQAFQEIPKIKAGVTHKAVPQHRCAPPPGNIKINFDAAVFKNTLDIGVGVICRDSSGSCIAWFSHRLTRFATTELAEAFAAREALLLASRHGLQSFQLEGDCEVLIRKFQSPNPDSSTLGVVIEEIKQLASLLLCSFSIVRRKGNNVAHILAQNSSSRLEGISNYPPCIASLLATDFHI